MLVDLGYGDAAHHLPGQARLRQAVLHLDRRQVLVVPISGRTILTDRCWSS